MKYKVPITLLILLLIIIPVLAVSYPKLTDFVTDNADIISPEYEQKITELAKQIEQNTTAEIAVVTINSLEGISKEQYALELFEQAGIGKEDKDNGLLILVALEERQYRFEVGYGLEGSIPDASKVNIGIRIIEPNFKQGEYGKGIYESLVVVKGMLENDPEIISKYQSQYYPQRRASTIKLWFYLFFFFLFFISGFLGRRRGRGFMFIPLFLPGARGGFSGGVGGFGSSGFGGFGGGLGGGGGFGGSF